jgi:methyl-accepting chemotaxis protein
VASLQEVARQVQQAGDGVDKVAAALRQAGELAHDAAELLRSACHGAVTLEDEAAQIGGLWSDVADGTE